MVRDSNQIKSTEFIELLLDNIPKEDSSYVLSGMFLYLDSCVDSFCPDNKYAAYKSKAFDVVYKMLLKETEQDSIVKLQAKLVANCWSDESVSILASWLEGNNEELKRFTPNLQEKWSIVSYIYAREYGTSQYREALKAKLEEEDTTDMKREFGFRIAALTANREERQQLWKEYMDKDLKMSFHMLGKSTGGFNSKWVPYDLRKEYFDDYYNNIIEILKTRPRTIGATLYRLLKPEFENHDECVRRNEELEKHLKEMD